MQKAGPQYRRFGFLITDIWRSCRFLGALFRALRTIPGGIGRFIPCDVGANHCRLRHIGWEKCGHGLTSRPRETASEEFLNELLGLFRCPPGSAAALLGGGLLVGSLLGVFRYFWDSVSATGLEETEFVSIQVSAP